MTTQLQKFRNNVRLMSRVARQRKFIELQRGAQRIAKMTNTDVRTCVYTGYGVTFDLEVNVNELDGFNDRRLKVALEALDVEWKSEDEPAWQRREFKGSIEIDDLARGERIARINVNVHARLKDAPKRCKIVEVGRDIEYVPATTRERVKRIFVCD